MDTALPEDKKQAHRKKLLTRARELYNFLFVVGSEPLTDAENERLVAQERQSRDIDSTIADEREKYKNGRKVGLFESGYERIMAFLEHSNYGTVREARNMSSEELEAELFTHKKDTDDEERRSVLSTEFFKRHTLAQKSSNGFSAGMGVLGVLQDAVVAVIATSPVLGGLLYFGAHWLMTGLPDLNVKRNEKFQILTNAKINQFLLEKYRGFSKIEREARDAGETQKEINQLSGYNTNYNQCRTRFWQGLGGFMAAGMTMLAPALLLGQSPLILMGTFAAITGLSWNVTHWAAKSRERVVLAYREGNDKYARGIQGKLLEALKSINLSLQYPAVQRKADKALLKQAQGQSGTIKKLGKKWAELFLKRYSLMEVAVFGIAGAGVALGAAKDAASFLFMLSSVKMLIPSISALKNSLIDKQISTKSFAQLAQEYAHNPKYNVRTGEKQIDSNANTIVLRNIAHSNRNKQGEYEQTPLFASDETFKISTGVTVIGGASGAGKSRLLTLLQHGDDPVRGGIFIGNKDKATFDDFRTLAPNEVYKNIAISSQQAEWIEDTVEGYISYGGESVDKAYREKVLSALKLKEVEGGDQANSQFIDTNKSIDADNINFSGGQQKRIAVAQTLLSGKPILIFDEPTSGLDDRWRGIVSNLIDEAAQDKTVIYITHNSEELNHMHNVTQALDIDDNTITRYDLTSPVEKGVYVEFVKDRERAEAVERTQPREADRLDNADNTSEQRDKILQRIAVLEQQLAEARQLLAQSANVENVNMDVSVETVPPTAANYRQVQERIQQKKEEYRRKQAWEREEAARKEQRKQRDAIILAALDKKKR